EDGIRDKLVTGVQTCALPISHGRLDLAGMLPQAPSSDTTGWFARDAATFARVSEVMLGEPIPASLPATLVVAVDAFGFADAETRSEERRVGKEWGARRRVSLE